MATSKQSWIDDPSILYEDIDLTYDIDDSFSSRKNANVLARYGIIVGLTFLIVKRQPKYLAFIVFIFIAVAIMNNMDKYKFKVKLNPTTDKQVAVDSIDSTKKETLDDEYKKDRFRIKGQVLREKQINEEILNMIDKKVKPYQAPGIMRRMGKVNASIERSKEKIKCYDGYYQGDNVYKTNQELLSEGTAAFAESFQKAYNNLGMRNTTISGIPYGSPQMERLYGDDGEITSKRRDISSYVRDSY